MIQLVGITGYKRSGKGEVANALSDSYPGVVYQIGFADKMKRLAAEALGLEGDPRELIAMMDEAKLPLDGGGWLLHADKTAYRQFHVVSGRQYLQNLGSKARDLLGEDIWVNQVLPEPGLTHETETAALRSMYPHVDVVVFTDLRFENEAARIEDLGGVIWEVHRPGVESDGHASEQKLHPDFIDWVIPNTGTLGDLGEQVELAIQGTLR